MYVSGHTHRNMFFDDGVKRIYADNQIGYRNESPHLKSFLMDGEYDYFCNFNNKNRALVCVRLYIFFSLYL